MLKLLNVEVLFLNVTYNIFLLIFFFANFSRTTYNLLNVQY